MASGYADSNRLPESNRRPSTVPGLALNHPTGAHGHDGLGYGGRRSEQVMHGEAGGGGLDMPLSIEQCTGYLEERNADPQLVKHFKVVCACVRARGCV